MFHTRLTVACDPAYTEILMAEIAEAGFDSFLETDSGFEAYAENDNYDDHQLTFLLEKYSTVRPLSFAADRIEKKNWNEEWEKNLEMIAIEDQVVVRAEFHKPEKKYPFEIIITPKMSFGTGHHQTTRLMLGAQLRIEHRGKRVIDAGCGTAVLSIMASLRGASRIEAFDIDEWSVINAGENAAANGCANISIRQGTIATLLFSEPADIILANINKNILLSEIALYTARLAGGGHLLMSGFYDTDADDLTAVAAAHGLVEQSRSAEDRWTAVLFKKRNN